MKKISVIIFLFAIYFNVSAEISKIRMMFNETPSTSVTIAWVQDSGEKPILAYDNQEGLKADNQLTFVAKPFENYKYLQMHHYFVRLDNLIPETVYYFQIVDSKGTSKQYWFKTLPENPEKLSIIAGGDSRSHPEIRRLANRMVAKLQPDFVIFDGDFTVIASASQWAIWLDDWQLTIANGRIIPIIAVQGNHEASKDLEKIFLLPKKSYYSLDFGKLFHLTVLNTGTEIGGKQTKWLKKDLESTSTIWKSVVYHKPIRPHYTKKSEGEEQYKYWATPFYENKVDFVTEGDTHTCKITYPIRPDKNGDEGFVRDDENGTIYVGEGTWGAPIRDADDNKSWTMESAKINQFKWIFVDKDKIDLRTVMYENVDEVGQLTFENRFEIPENLNLWKAKGQDVVVIKAK